MRQGSLFEEKSGDVVSVNYVADHLGVSIASVRNWIKTGLLSASDSGGVEQHSLEAFKENILGKSKLNARVNKSLKDSHNHEGLESKINEALTSEDPDEIAKLYESLLSESYKNKEGIFYTPKNVAREFFQSLPGDCSELTFCDPCCGSGIFLLEALNNGFKPQNIYGFDTDPVAVRIAQSRLSAVHSDWGSNIKEADFFDSIEALKERYDVVITNPPWGKKMPKKDRDEIGEFLQSGKSKDTSSLFFFGCLKILRPGGFLGLLLQDAFFNIAGYEDARRAALSKQIIQLIDFGKPFKGLMTKAKGIVLRNTPADGKGKIVCSSSSSTHRVNQENFDNNPQAIFNFTCSPDEIELVNFLLRKRHITLKGRAKWGLGIVTGNNKKYCSQKPQEGYIPVFKGSDILRDGLKPPSCFIPFDLSLYQQVAPRDIYDAKEKLIYKFISSELRFFYDDKQRYVLNSANVLVLDSDFPISSKQVADLLNSKIISWLFKKTFDTHKVLRKDLETLPIFFDYFKEHNEVEEKALLDYLGIEENSDGAYRIKRRN